jgi:hypothetical protein
MPRIAYFIDVSHENLGKFRRITGSDKYVVEQQARSQQLICPAANHSAWLVILIG